MNASSIEPLVRIPRRHSTGPLEAALAAGTALLAHVREILKGVGQTREIATMNDWMLRDIGVEAAWPPTLHRELEYPRL